MRDMMNKKIITIGIIFLFIVVLINFILFFSGDNETQNNEEKASYKIVSNNITIETNKKDNYTVYISAPQISGEPLKPIINNFTTNGEINYSLVEVDTPLNREEVLKIEGISSGSIRFNRTFWTNTSIEREKYQSYQITDLSLLYNDRNNAYFYCDENISVNITFRTYYLSVYGEERWKCYWKTDGKIKLHEGWNEVELNHYCDPDS